MTVSLVCVQMRSGVEIWVEADRAEKLQTALAKLSSHKFIRYEDQTVNTADIVGVFTAETMADNTRRKNGQWQCEGGTWHGRGQDCTCKSRRRKEFEEAYFKEHGYWPL